MDETESLFGAVEYGVYAAVLVLSAAIGVFYGCFGSKQKSTEEFLMANRQMSVLPVALSLMCSFVSAITLLGNTAEIYLYGTQYGMIILSFIPLTLSLAYLYVPVFFNLQLSSAYEYLEMRFSNGTRMFVSSLAILHLLTRAPVFLPLKSHRQSDQYFISFSSIVTYCTNNYLTVYMAIVVLGPSLALEQVTGINPRLSTGAIFLVSIFYSALGGLKAVVWTDALQAVIMLGSLTAVVVKGILDVGGIEIIWERAQNSSRVEFFNIDPDPRTRHTLWTATFGGYFMWLPMYAATQAQIQRYLSLPSLKSCRRALIINMFGLMFVITLCFLAGLGIYGKYFDCDPIKSEIVTSSDQLLPYFVMDTSGNIPGIPGLFVAGLTCASLSTVSTCLNALASISTYDYVRKLVPGMSDEKLSTTSKFLSVFFGAVSFGFVFVAEQMGNILPATSSLVGAIVGPTLGIFTLGMFFPWANTRGAVLGMLTSFLLMVAYVVGVFVASSDKLLPDQRLYLSVEGCQLDPVTNNTQILNSFKWNPDHLASDVNWEHQRGFDWKSKDDTILIQLLSVSYIWYPGMGCVLTIILGLLFSAIFNCWGWRVLDGRHKIIRAELFSPPVYALWCKLFPGSMAKFIDPEEDLIVINFYNTIGTHTKSNSIRSKESNHSNEFKREPLCELKIKPL